MHHALKNESKKNDNSGFGRSYHFLRYFKNMMMKLLSKLNTSHYTILPDTKERKAHKKNFLFLCFLAFIGFTGCEKDGAFKREISPWDFLCDKNYDEVTVEIQSVNGYEPSSATLNNLTTFLQNRLNKSNITIARNSIMSPNKSSFSLDDIKEIEKENREEHTKKRTLTAYILFLDGDYSANIGSSKVLGIAYGKTSIAIFEKTILEFSGGIGKPPTNILETTVSEHEFGHLLGLVNNGTSMHINHQDSVNGKHCNVKDCLMYYSAETSDIVANLLGGKVPALDSHCIDDLKDNGGK
jgi:hypothetical protein